MDGGPINKTKVKERDLRLPRKEESQPILVLKSTTNVHHVITKNKLENII